MSLPVLGAAILGGSKIAGGFAQASSDNYQAAVARNNAIIARQNQAYSASAGAAQTEQAGLKARAQDAETRAGLAASGVNVNTGSAVDVQQSQREIGQLDAETVANNAALQAYGYATQATGYDAQAALDKRSAGFAIEGGILGGVGSVLGNANVDAAFAPKQVSTSQTQLDAGPVSLLPSPSLLSGDQQLPDEYQWMSADNAAGMI